MSCSIGRGWMLFGFEGRFWMDLACVDSGLERLIRIMLGSYLDLSSSRRLLLSVYARNAIAIRYPSHIINRGIVSRAHQPSRTLTTMKSNAAATPIIALSIHPVSVEGLRSCCACVCAACRRTSADETG